MLFHFDFANWWLMLRLAWGERNPWARGVYLAKLLFWVPPVAAFHALCFALDWLLVPELRRCEVRAPVFVIGHARSGTTLVHRLMSRDEGRFSSFRLYEMFFPSLLQKRAIRGLAGLDARFLGGFLEKRVRAWGDHHYASHRAVHPTGLTEAEEDDQVLYFSCAAGYWITKMPYMGDLDFYYVDRWPEPRRRRLMRFYADCIRRQLVLNGADRTHLSKNPVFPGRTRALLETFPDARFVIPVRNPFETIPSLLKLVRSGWKALGWEEARQQRCLKILADQSTDTYLYPLRVLEEQLEVPRAVVDYRDVVADPARAVEEIYRALEIPMSSAYRELLLAEGKRAREHRSGHAYSLEEFGLDAAEIHRSLAELFDRFGWQAPPAREPQAPGEMNPNGGEI